MRRRRLLGRVGVAVAGGIALAGCAEPKFTRARGEVVDNEFDDVEVSDLSHSTTVTSEGETFVVTVTLRNAGESAVPPSTVCPRWTLYDASGNRLARETTTVSLELPAGETRRVSHGYVGDPDAVGRYEVAITRC